LTVPSTPKIVVAVNDAKRHGRRGTEVILGIAGSLIDDADNDQRREKTGITTGERTTMAKFQISDGH
jgi:hypothetical protein